MGVRCSWLRVGVVLLTALLTVGYPLQEACADERAQLEIAVSRFKAAQYEKALALLEVILTKPVDPKDKARAKLLAEARPVYAATLIWLDRSQEADSIILSHLRTDPFYEPPPGEFHQKVVERFIKVRSEHRSELEKAKREIQRAREDVIAADEARKNLVSKRIAELEKLASQERVIHQRSRWVAMAPFGIGQFQNDDKALGVVFAVGQGLSLVGSLVTGVVAQDLGATRCGAPDPTTGQSVDCGELQSQYTNARTANWVSGGLFASLLLGGIIQAQVAFEPESTEVRERPLPKNVSLTPWFDPEGRGAGAAARIRF